MVISVLSGWASLSGCSAQVDQELTYYTVEHRSLPLTVMERGTLQSQDNAAVYCEVDDIRDDSVSGTTILWMIENGTHVKKGDLIVELDTASHLERLDKQILQTTYAQGQFTARTLDYENRLTINETVKANAELAVPLAKLELEQFENAEGDGTFKIDLQEIEFSIRAALAQHQILDNNLVAIRELEELGYKGKGELSKARLEAMGASHMIARQAARMRELVSYDYAVNKRQLEVKLNTAERDLIQVERDNAAALAQNKGWLTMATMGKVWHEARLAQYQKQLEKCKIYAPVSGMVAYHMRFDDGKTETIERGDTVRYRQHILSIPDLSRMQVSTSVHESMVDRVRPGMRATIRLAAFPDRTYAGTVDSVDVLADPSGWASSDTKFYKTVVTLDNDVDDINPGMTAIVEIHIDQLNDRLCVPIQSVVQRGKESWCFVDDHGQPEKRRVEVGRVNAMFAEIRAGLEVGERVVIQPAKTLDHVEGTEIAPDSDNLHAWLR